MGYFWKHSENVNMSIQLIDFNILDLIDIEDSYLNSLEFTHGYQDVLISATRFSYIFNNQKTNKGRYASFFIASAETAGNLLQLLDQVKPASTPENNKAGQYFGVPYSQYFKIDLDYRHYTRFRQGQNLAWRVMGGYTQTYGNTSGELPPFEKSYFAGGTGDLRGFRAYRLGPGNFEIDEYEQEGTNSYIFNAVAPIKLMFNIEYRFTILNELKGALFLDAGNIWYYNDERIKAPIDSLDENVEFYKFKFENITEQIAASVGFGLRYDFTFFVFRLDAAIPLVDPRLPLDRRFTPKEPGYFGFNYQGDLRYPNTTNNYILNFAIGYPF